MKKYSLWISSILLMTQLEANDSFNSEIGHVIGGAVMAGGVAAAVDRYYPEYRANRAMIGFGLSSAAIIAFESMTIALHGDSRGQLLDMASHITGSALGAFVTDQCILSPVVQNLSTEGKYIGVSVQRTF